MYSRAELLVDAIGGGDFLGHGFTRQFGNGARGGDFHLFVDRGRPHIQRAAEDEGEAEHVVDLVGKIAAPGGDDRIGAHRLRFVRHDFRRGIGHREDDRLIGHLAHPFRLQRTRGGKAEEDIRAFERRFKRAVRGIHCMRAFPLVHPFAPRIDRAGAVTDDDVFMRYAHRLDQRGAGERRCARAVDHHLAVLELAPGEDSRR